MFDLEGPRLKVARARSEIERLRLAEDSFRENTKYQAVRAELNPRSGNYVYRVRIEGLPPSPDWGVYIGEIAHNLRSALDGLVYQLALLDANTRATNTQFPIFLVGRTKRKRRKGKELIAHFEHDGKRMIQPLSEKHKAMIERLQPYKRGNRAPIALRGRRQRGRRNSPLWWLQEINNADKHRLIQVVGVKRGGSGYGHWGGTNPTVRFSRGILKDGARFCEAPPEVHINPKVFPLVAFSEGCRVVTGLGVYYVLSEIAKKVSSIIESFDP